MLNAELKCFSSLFVSKRLKTERGPITPISKFNGVQGWRHEGFEVLYVSLLKLLKGMIQFVECLISIVVGTRRNVKSPSHLLYPSSASSHIAFSFERVLLTGGRR